MITLAPSLRHWSPGRIINTAWCDTPMHTHTHSLSLPRPISLAHQKKWIARGERHGEREYTRAHTYRQVSARGGNSSTRTFRVIKWKHNTTWAQTHAPLHTHTHTLAHVLDRSYKKVHPIHTEGLCQNESTAQEFTAGDRCPVCRWREKSLCTSRTCEETVHERVLQTRNIRSSVTYTQCALGF